MKILSIFFIAALCFAFPNRVQAQGPWNKLYNFNPNPAYFNSVAYTHFAEDAYFFSAGTCYIPQQNTNNCFVSKIDYQGNVLKQSFLHRDGSPLFLLNGSNIAKVSTGKYVLSGSYFDTTNNPKTGYQSYLYFFNKDLDSLDFVTNADTSDAKYPYSVTVDHEKNIIVSGNVLSKPFWDNFSQQYIYNFSSTWVCKYDSTGKSIWSKTYLQTWHSINYSSAQKIIETTNNDGYLLSGIASDYPKDTLNSFIAKIDKNGDLVWSKKLPNTYCYYRATYTDITPLSNGNYAFTANYNDTAIAERTLNGRGWQPSANKLSYGVIDNNGNILWHKQFTYPDKELLGRFIAEAEHGDLLIGCLGNMLLPFLLRTTADGEIKSYREYNYVTTPPNIFIDQEQTLMSLTPNGNILSSGQLISQNRYHGTFDSIGAFSWHFLTDTNGCIVPGCQLVDTMWHTSVQNINSVASDISIYPNPASDVINIKSATPLNGSLRIVDINGRTAYRQPISGNLNIINIQKIPPGLYIIEIADHNGLLKREKLQKY